MKESIKRVAVSAIGCTPRLGLPVLDAFEGDLGSYLVRHRLFHRVRPRCKALEALSC